MKKTYKQDANELKPFFPRITATAIGLADDSEHSGITLTAEAKAQLRRAAGRKEPTRKHSGRISFWCPVSFREKLEDAMEILCVDNWYDLMVVVFVPWLRELERTKREAASAATDAAPKKNYQ